MTTKVSAGDLFGLNDQLIKLAMPLIALVVDIYFICRDIDSIKWCRVNLLCLSFSNSTMLLQPFYKLRPLFRFVVLDI